MDYGIFNLSFLALLLFLYAGVFSLYTVFKLNKLGHLFDSRLLYPSNCNRSNCKDEAEYLAFIKPRLLIFGILSLVAAIGEFLVGHVFAGQRIFEMVVLGVELCVFVFMFWTYHTAFKRYW